MMTSSEQAHNAEDGKPAGYHRRRAYAVWVGAMIVAFFIYMAAPAALPLFGLSPWVIGAPLPFLMIALTVFGLAWLALYVFGARGKRDPGRGAGPPHA